MIGITPRRISYALCGAGGLVFAAGLVAGRAPVSSLLLARSPDQSLAPATIQFLDRIPWLVAVLGALAVAAALSPALRRALAGAWREPAAGDSPTRLIPLLAIATGVARLAVASVSDVGLGDDGARVVWLERWWRDPEPIWHGFWAPGHLYVQALFTLVTRDAVRAGILVSALAATGTAWILGRHAESHWGRPAAVLAVLFVALSPVGSAYGAVPDVNPFFAFTVVAGITAARHAAVTRRWRWLWISWIALAFAAWSRFEGFVLAPAAALTLWPDRRRALLFGLACLLPSIGWSFADWLTTGQAARVIGAVQHDPGLRSSKISQLFSFLGGLWQGIGVPLAVAAIAGIARAWRAGKGRVWCAPLALHAAVLTGAMVTSGAGTQPRYWILAGALAGVYAAAAIGGVWRRSRPLGAALAAGTLVAVVTLPGLFPGEGFLWACRDARARTVADAVRAQAGTGAVLWISEHGAYHYACRTRLPIERYAALGRADDSPASALAALATADTVLACVEWVPRPRAQWDSVTASWRGDIAPVEERDGYRMFRMLPHRAASRRPSPTSCCEARRYGLIDGRMGIPRYLHGALGAIGRPLDSLPPRTEA